MLKSVLAGKPLNEEKALPKSPASFNSSIQDSVTHSTSDIILKIGCSNTLGGMDMSNPDFQAEMCAASFDFPEDEEESKDRSTARFSGNPVADHHWNKAKVA